MELPPALAEAAIIGPTSELVRRIEIYESDAITRWDGGANDDRLIDGSVNIDYSSDERRSVDLTLDNSDFGLEHTPEAFWYDKILKVFCGVKFADTTPLISYNIRTNLLTNPSFETNLTSWTSANVTLTRDNTWSGPSGSYSAKIVPSSTSNDTFLAIPAPPGGVWVQGETYTISATTYIPVALTGSVVTSRNNRIWVVSTAGTALAAESAIASATGTTRLTVTFTVPIGATAVVARLYNGYTNSAANAVFWDEVIVETGTTNGTYFDGATQDFANRDYAWTGTAHASTSTETITITTDRVIDSAWEVQVGEFMIDTITEDHFPYVVRVTGRDYTKKCLLSKFATATAFADGTAIETAVTAMAQNAGITKFLMPVTGHALGKDYVYERGVPRWEAMKEIANAFGYELFFDAQGYLVMREYLDPVTAPIAYTLATGALQGNLVSYTKTVNDNRIYNKIVVTGESSDAAVVPVSAIATNTSPDSPTRIAKLGERVYQYTSSFIVTTQQAQDVADKFLQIHALEEFDLNFSSIALPWLEVGEIIEFLDPRPSDGQPTRFLLSSLSLPLSLDAMSGNAKRVSVVG